MAKSAFIRARVEPELKTNAENCLKALGLSMTDAITLFLKQVQLKKALPFAVEIPNAETLKVFRESEKGVNINSYANAEEMFKSLGI